MPATARRSFQDLVEELRRRDELPHERRKTIGAVAEELHEHPRRVTDALDAIKMLEVVERLP